MNVNGTLFFTSSDGELGAELWGTAAGTFLAADVLPGAGGSILHRQAFLVGSLNDPTEYWFASMTGTLFFPANDGVHGTRPWRVPVDPFIVTTTADSGNNGDLIPGSFRAAIVAANAAPAANLIRFAIPGTGVRTIRPTALLPLITQPLVIDAYTQPGSSTNGPAVGDTAVLRIELDGSLTNGDGLSLAAGGCTIRGLIINRFDRFAVNVSGGVGNSIAGNFLGTDAGGTASLSNGGGIVFWNGASSNVLLGHLPRIWP